MDQNRALNSGCNTGFGSALGGVASDYAIKGACDVSTPATPAGWGRIHFTREDGIGTFSIDRHLSAAEAAECEQMIRSFLSRLNHSERAEQQAMRRKQMAAQEYAMKQALTAADNQTGF